MANSSRACAGRGSTASSGSNGSSPAPPRYPLGTAIVELHRGRARLALLRDLALGEWSHKEIAEALGVSTADIAHFAEEFADDITEVRRALAGQLAIETAGLWIAKQQNRIAELQADFESTEPEISAIRQHAASLGEHGSGPGSRHHRELIKTRLTLLKAVAEELDFRRTGPKADDLPSAETDRVHYVLDIAHTEALS